MNNFMMSINQRIKTLLLSLRGIEHSTVNLVERDDFYSFMTSSLSNSQNYEEMKVQKTEVVN